MEWLATPYGGIAAYAAYPAYAAYTAWAACAAHAAYAAYAAYDSPAAYLHHQTLLHTRRVPGSLWIFWGSVLAHWNSFGWLRGICGFPLDHLIQLVITFQANVLFVSRLRTKYRLPELACGACGALGAPRNGFENCTTRPYIHTRRGPGSLWMSFGVLSWPTEIPLVSSRAPVDSSWTIF